MEKYLDYLRKLEYEFETKDKEKFVAKIILAHVLRCDIDQLFAHLDEEVSVVNELKIDDLAYAYLQGNPIQYILGYGYFYGLKLKLDKNVLIPRMETEELVEWVLQDNQETALRCVDIGTGSGCVALAIKSKRPSWKVEGFDISKEAIEIAKDNALLTALDVSFFYSDFLSDVGDFDILVSNPPYIALDDEMVSEEVKTHEPHLALYTSDALGLDSYKTMFDQLLDKDFKYAYFEFGYMQKKDLQELLKAYPYKYEFKVDMNGNDRMLRIHK